MLHGGGHSALSWAFTSFHLQSIKECSVLCYDLRGHGKTICEDENLSIEQMTKDLADIITATGMAESRKVVLVGHSMGGAIVVHAAHSGIIKGLLGTVVIDVVEGTALESLIHMKSFLLSRPTQFSSEEDAVCWALSHNQVRNKHSAKFTIPSQLSKDRDIYRWRTDLQKSSQFWLGWFTGLSKKFLEMKGGRLLVLAGSDRLDKDLMIGQMQGKFQLVLLPESSHSIHEDQPDKLAAVLLEFWDHNQPLVFLKR
jgi:pimeloyl-ACP methyl ester carboxylesterase